MKTKGFALSVIVFMTFGLSSIFAQPHNAQWPFYLAFEDATGASDTIWLVMDQGATFSGLDPQFGEAREEKKLTQEQLGELVDKKRTYKSGKRW